MMLAATEAIFRMKLRGRHEIRFDALSRLHSLLVGKIPGNFGARESTHRDTEVRSCPCRSLLTRPRRRPDLARPQHDQTTPNDNPMPICCTQKGVSHRDIVIARGMGLPTRQF